MHGRHVTVRGVLLFALALGSVPPAAARAAPATSTIEVDLWLEPSGRDGVQAEVTVVPPAWCACGLAVGLAFSSGELTFAGVEELWMQDALVFDGEPQEDAGNADGDPRTDRIVRLAWMEQGSCWPGGGDEVSLARLLFRTVEGRTFRIGRDAPAVTLVSLSGERRYMFPPVLRAAGPSSIEREHGRRSRAARVERRFRGVVELGASSELLDGPGGPLDVDGDGREEALTDGVLIARYQRGLRGERLVEGALGATAARRDPVEVEAFLEGATQGGAIDPTGGAQIVRAMLGFEALDTIPRVRRTARPPVLELFAPALDAPLLSLVKADIQPLVVYRGTDPLSFELEEGPTEMVIDERSGTLAWTPPASVEGSAVTVRLSATDGSATAEVSFSIQIATTTTVAAELSGTTLTITESGSLHDVAFTFPSEVSRPLSELSVAVVASSQAPDVPSGVTRLTDFFRVTPVETTGEGLVTLTLPASVVPASRVASELRLFVYTKPQVAGSVPVWVCSWHELDVLPGGATTTTVGALGELSFIGAGTPEPSGAWIPVGSIAPGQTWQRAGVTISCAPKELSDGTTLPDVQVCMVTGDQTMTVTVKDFDRNQWAPAATVGDLVGWLVDARAKVYSLGMRASPVFEAVVEPMPRPDWLGFVSSVDNRRVLHLKSGVDDRDLMHTTAQHEYFHHAQSRTVVAGLGNLLINGGNQTDWLIEGSARWFEDEVSDSLNTYRKLWVPPVAPILEPGLGARFDSWNRQTALMTDPYARAFFLKLVASRCPGLNMAEVLNADLASDPSGIANFAARLTSTAWRCDFASGFGESNTATLASALLYYDYATQRANSIALLDPDEIYLAFTPPQARLLPARGCTDVYSCPWSAYRGEGLPPAAAVTFEVAPVDPVGQDEEVVLEVTLYHPPAWVWVGDDASHGALHQGTWFSALGTNRYVYGQSGRAPRLYVIAVNPSATSRGSVGVLATIRPRGTVILPFSASSEWTDPTSNYVWATDVKWTFTTQGEVSGPAGMQVAASVHANPNFANNHEVVADTGTHAPPFDVVFTGYFDAVPDKPTGSVTEGGRIKRWEFSNQRLHMDWPRGALEAGSSFTHTYHVAAPHPFEQYPICTVFQVHYWETDEDNKVLLDTTFDKVRGCLALKTFYSED